MIRIVPPSFVVRLFGKQLKAPAAVLFLLALVTLTASFMVPGYLRFGKMASPNDVAITDITPAWGTLSRVWNNQNPVAVTVKNNGTLDQTDVVVELDVTGANTEHLTQTISYLAAGAETTIGFTATVAAAGTQTLEAKVADDDDNSNNTKQAAQEITCNKTGYTSSEPVHAGYGFGAGTGIAATRFQAPDAPVQISGVTVHIANSPDNIGKSVTGVLLDDLGNIITDAPPFTATASDLNTTVQINFYFPVTVSAGSIFYAGIRLDEGNQEPVGLVHSTPNASERNFTFPYDGGTPTLYAAGSHFKINVISEIAAELNTTVTGPLPAGQSATFTATPGFELYTFKVNGTTQQSSDANEFTYTPANNDEVSVEIGVNGCSTPPLGNYVITVNGISPTNGILYVNKNNPTPGDGSSWSNALTELADALRWAKSKEADWTSADPLQIWVAGGTYKPLYSPADDNFGNPDGMNNAFLLVKNVKVYGGFSGTEAQLHERDLKITANKSILSGDYNGDDVISGNAANYDLSITGTLENAGHIIIASGTMEAAVLDGFTITGAGGDPESLLDVTVNGNVITKLGGGGIHNYNASPSYSNLVIKGNRNSFYGAGIYNDQSSPVFTNILIIDNLSELFGGGILNANMSSPVFTSVTISNNFAAADAGGMGDINSSPVVRNTILFGNSSPYMNDNSTPVFTYCLIQDMPEDPANHILNGSLDPHFTDPAAGDYTLSITSPALNVGSNVCFETGQHPDLTHITTDLAGNPRITGTATDLGAYESNSNDQFITAHDVDVTYGDADYVLTATASSGLPVSYSIPDDEVAELYQDAGDQQWKMKIKKAGAVQITVSQPGNETYDPAPEVPIVFIVNRKELVVTADDIIKEYGASLPPLTITYTGFVNGDTTSAITPPSITTNATASSDPGTYPILLMNGDADNYQLKLVNGTLTVPGAAITITQQPKDIAICAGSQLSLIVKASVPHGTTINYQWQHSADNNTWNIVKGATASSYNIVASNDGYYRCVLTAPGRELITHAASITVKPAEKATINLPNMICLSDGRVTLSASLPGGVFSGTGVSGNTWKLDTLRPGLYNIQYTYTNPNGCAVTASKSANLSLCDDKRLITAIKAQPNPTTGWVTVRTLHTETSRQTVIVSNGFGQQVITKYMQLRKGWNQLNFDLTGHRAGLYFITISGHDGKPASVISIMKQ